MMWGDENKSLYLVFLNSQREIHPISVCRLLWTNCCYSLPSLYYSKSITTIERFELETVKHQGTWRGLNSGNMVFFEAVNVGPFIFVSGTNSLAIRLLLCCNETLSQPTASWSSRPRNWRKTNIQYAMSKRLNKQRQLICGESLKHRALHHFPLSSFVARHFCSVVLHWRWTFGRSGGTKQPKTGPGSVRNGASLLRTTRIYSPSLVRGMADRRPFPQAIIWNQMCRDEFEDRGVRFDGAAGVIRPLGQWRWPRYYLTMSLVFGDTSAERNVL